MTGHGDEGQGGEAAAAAAHGLVAASVVQWMLCAEVLLPAPRFFARGSMEQSDTKANGTIK